MGYTKGLPTAQSLRILCVACMAAVAMLVLCLTPRHVRAQGGEDDIFRRLRAESSALGRVQIVQPAQLEGAMARYVSESAKHPTMRGYRVRIYRDVGKAAREASRRIQEQVLSEMPGTPVYRTFEAPNYRVTVGDFRTRFEALYFRKRLLPRYPQAFVVTATINFPSLRTADSVSDAGVTPAAVESKK